MLAFTLYGCTVVLTVLDILYYWAVTCMTHSTWESLSLILVSVLHPAQPCTYAQALVACWNDNLLHICGLAPAEQNM